MAVADTLLPLKEVTRRLRILGQSYVGVRTIPVDRIVGSVDRSVDFDRFFRPRGGELRKRLAGLRSVFGERELPPIQVYEAGGVYFVIDGHHRVALSREQHREFIDAEVTAMRLSNELNPGVDFLDLVHTEQHRNFKERTGLLQGNPDAKIEFSRPIGYAELLEVVQAHAYELSSERSVVVPMPEVTADWYRRSWLPALEAIATAGLDRIYWFKTDGDRYLWVYRKLRELQTTNPDATWLDAATARAREPVHPSHRSETLRYRRRPLPSHAKSDSAGGSAEPMRSGVVDEVHVAR